MKHSQDKKPRPMNFTRHDPDPSKGLSDAEVKERVDGGWSNAANVKVEKSYGRILFENFFTFFSVVLYSVALIFIAFRIFLSNTGHEDLAGAYFGASKFFYLGPLFFSIIIGTVQEIRSKQVLDKLKIVSDSRYTVIRNGVETKLLSHDLVLDDIVKLEAGAQIPADMSLLSGYLEVNESLLTGESDDVKKDCSKGKCTLLSGSSIVSGSCYAVVTAVGKDTYANRLQQKVKNIVKSKSELMRNIYGIINTMSIFLYVIVAVVVATMAYKIWRWGADSSIFITDATKTFIEHNFNGSVVPSSIDLTSPYSWSIIITTASAFAIGVIPTGLVLLTSVTLAVSVVSLAKKKTLIQELYSLENLSRIDTICLDKTGTLTDGSMSVEETIFADPSQKESLAKRLGSFLGALPSLNATSTALASAYPVNKEYAVNSVVPFSSARKRSEVSFADGQDCFLGAPEYLLGEADASFRKTADEKAALGFRVLAFTLGGRCAMLLVLKDNVRPSAPSTIRYFNENGVEVKIISGDNPITVGKIAEACGVLHCDAIVSLENVPLEKMEEYASKYTIFGRVSPEQKEALVTALQKQGKKVAMTGDGVNDILALRKANSSISFRNATDAAKSCSDVVLMDNDFGHLKEVVGQGRRVVNNIQRTSILFLMKTICIALLAFLLIPFKKGQSEFTIENIYLMQTGVIAIAGFLLSVEACPRPIKGSFKTNVYPQAATAGLLMVLGALIPCILNVIMVDGKPLMSADNARSMISLLTTFAGFTVLFRMCVPFSRYRVFVYSFSLGVNILLAFAMPSVYVGGRSWSFHDIIKNGWNSELFKNFFNLQSPVFTALGTPEYVTLLLFIVVGLPLYILTSKYVAKWATRWESQHSKA
jgi:cation-transporting ATPase E